MPPINYGWLQRATGEVLQRTIPKGVNWGALPGQFLNTLDDIYRMAPGASREAARSQAKRTLQRSAATPPARPTGTMGASGQFRAPSIGAPGPARAPGVSIPQQTAVGRGPYAVDYGLRRQVMGAVRKAAPRVTSGTNPALNLGRNPLMMGLRLINNPITQGIVLGTTVAAPLAVGAGEYLRSDRGQLLKDRLRQGDFGGAFNALTGNRTNTPISFDVGESLSSRPTNVRQQPRTGGSSPPAPTLPPPPGIDETLTSSRAPASTQRGPQVPGAGAGNLAAVAPTVYDMTPEGQFQRYMQGSEMNRYFGGPASAQAPKDAAAMQETAMLQQAPTTMPLSDYYRSQSATGRANMDNIVSSMGYTGNMEQWARANPMLAQRAYAQQFQGGVPTQGAPGAVPAVDAALNPAGPEFRGVGGNGELIYNFAADDVTPEKIKAFQDLLKKQSAQ